MNISESNNQKQLGIHIGLPKTGTTSLQKLCFEQHKELAYLGQTNIWTNNDAKQILKYLILGDDSGVTLNNAREILATLFSRHRAIMLSDEALSYGQFMLRATKWPIISSHQDVALRAKALADNVSIFIVLRNQTDWLQSWQKQGLKTAKYVETDFNQWLNKEMAESKQKMFDLLDYSNLYDAYLNVFGAENVHVFLYEQYCNDFEVLAKKIVEKLGIDSSCIHDLMKNERENVTAASFRGLPPGLHKFVKSDFGKEISALIPRGIIKKIRSSIEIERDYSNMNENDVDVVKQYFNESNQRLFDKLGNNPYQRHYVI